MRDSLRTTPFSDFVAHGSEVLAEVAEQRQPLVLTENGEPKAVLQDMASYTETQETLALLAMLALGQQEVDFGKVRPAAEVVARLRAKRAETRP
ncbi:MULTISPECIES: type II toxin-antitoxin system Phd/YefM family antitoxin [unclassified Rubrivivax]|uniref:type II toxin-antitoxin system Phd/YefM family antitoxin n=1 Tax=unclassified Rubrivivax TaxID=2649762 RepID=UPI001E3BBD08|nr:MULTISPECIES: type II toxin-antitoxin system Phd/YefM family antitoxin [unclassified Rubrivivax]MCC9597762.1 type II toxin-antitoxin system Phd/YefM family antitoxin [Rubrivivax sp. JA1055]MCC9645981.1 type II toxin-antitoxin system Phd/YefM family antitoxin [Rubrivivax sp. JA1029]